MCHGCRPNTGNRKHFIQEFYANNKMKHWNSFQQCITLLKINIKIVALLVSYIIYYKNIKMCKNTLKQLFTCSSYPHHVWRARDAVPDLGTHSAKSQPTRCVQQFRITNIVEYIYKIDVPHIHSMSRTFNVQSFTNFSMGEHVECRAKIVNRWCWSNVKPDTWQHIIYNIVLTVPSLYSIRRVYEILEMTILNDVYRKRDRNPPATAQVAMVPVDSLPLAASNNNFNIEFDNASGKTDMADTDKNSHNTFF